MIINKTQKSDIMKCTYWEDLLVRHTGIGYSYATATAYVNKSSNTLHYHVTMKCNHQVYVI